MEYGQDALMRKLEKLKEACKRHKNINRLSDWVLFAMERHIIGNRATREFELAFLAYPDEELEQLVEKCLAQRDKSNDGIIRTCKKVMMRK